MKIIIKQGEITETATDSGLLIDQLAFSAGQWTENELFENNYDYESESVSYVFKEFNFENAFVDYLNSLSKEKTEAFFYSKADLELYRKQGLKLGAFIALTFPEWFDAELEKYKERIEEVRYTEDEEEVIKEYAPELWQEMEEAKKWFWDNLTSEWLNGDRSDVGVKQKIAKYYGATDFQYDHKSGDEFAFDFDDEELKERMADYYGEEVKMTKKNVKEWLIAEIEASIRSKEEKRIEESRKRREENEKTRKYKEERRKEAEQERINKLKSMKK